ncbi:MAG TPA: MFS transporter [Streptosporangiaceae bacterium]|nr:MFS transporter [Streptosporangiaceae bacterium]
MSRQEQQPVAASSAEQPAPAPRRASFWADLRVVWAEHDFRRLLSTRLVSQTGDGIFTAGLGTYVFFNASTFPNPAKGAAAFAVLYGPYSLIGPFAGVFIDRWSRRQILTYSALLRSAFVVITAALMASGNLGLPLYIAVLLVLGVNRFFLSALSAALPHVVAGDKLVMGNSVSPTAGGTLAAVGGLVGLGVNAATGDTEAGAAITLLVAGACYVAASLVARTMPKDLLGPARKPGQAATASLLTELRVVAIGLANGIRYVFGRRGPAAALGAIGGNRFFYGILFLMSILLYRNFFYHGAKASTAEAHFGYLVGATAIGYFCAALLTPGVTRRLSKPAVIAIALLVSGVLIGFVGETFSQVPYIVMGFFLGLAGQATAICATTILQEELPDEFRGRAFSYYDMMFNITFAAGALICLPFMPANGKSAGLMAFVGIGYVVVAAGYWAASRHSAGPGAPGGSMPADAAQASSS